MPKRRSSPSSKQRLIESCCGWMASCRPGLFIARAASPHAAASRLVSSIPCTERTLLVCRGTPFPQWDTDRPPHRHRTFWRMPQHVAVDNPVALLGPAIAVETAWIVCIKKGRDADAESESIYMYTIYSHYLRYCMYIQHEVNRVSYRDTSDHLTDTESEH